MPLQKSPLLWLHFRWIASTGDWNFSISVCPFSLMSFSVLKWDDSQCRLAVKNILFNFIFSLVFSKCITYISAFFVAVSVPFTLPLLPLLLQLNATWKWSFFLQFGHIFLVPDIYSYFFRVPCHNICIWSRTWLYCISLDNIFVGWTI